MASCGAAVHRPSTTSANPPSQTQPAESKLEKNKPFSVQIICPFSIRFSLESAASRITKDVSKYGVYYAEFMWIIIFIALIPDPERKVSLVCLVVMKEVAILYLLLLRAVANSVLFGWLIAFDTRPIVLSLLAIGTCLALVLTGAGTHLLITLALTFPIILAHAVLCIADDCYMNEEIDQESEPLASTV